MVSMTAIKPGKIALLWRGDRQARRAATPQNNRYNRIFEELAALGIEAEPAVYAEDMADEVRGQLLGCDGVLVWVDPISDGQNRIALDALLRDVASRGVWVSAHPEVILKMGVKEVLHRTKHLGWGTDTHLYRTANTFREEFPPRLGTAGPRVLKQNRGNGGQGVWKVELSSDATLRVLHARRGSVPETMALHDFMQSCEAYFLNDGCIVDQPFQSRLPDGMIRCYMGADKVVGYGHQFIKALIPPPPEGPELAGGAARPANHASGIGAAVPGAQDENGNRVDTADDGAVGNRRRLAADHLGCRLSLWAARCGGPGQLRALRDQCQLGVRDSGSGARRDRAPHHGPAAIEESATCGLT